MSPDLRTSRIIPAYAGSTSVQVFGWGSAADHPRIRGEHGELYEDAIAVDGSSPQTRGARICVMWALLAIRIIPAYAGSTRGVKQYASKKADHPRIRGEHPHDGTGVLIALGSSPHTRGAPKRAFKNARIVGIIPAYAGSTFPLTVARGAAQDHPRIRGEHIDTDRPGATGAGSSPHTRGARKSPRKTRGWPRIIPAYAGSTSTT